MTAKIWTPERTAELLRLWPDHAPKEVARLMGLPGESVRAQAYRLRREGHTLAAKRNGPPPRGIGRLYLTELHRIAAAGEVLPPMHEIAKRLSIALTAIRIEQAALIGADEIELLPAVPGDTTPIRLADGRVLMPGLSKRRRSWPPERVEQLRALSQSGITAKQAAERLGTSHLSLRAASARNGIRWPDPRTLLPKKPTKPKPAARPVAVKPSSKPTSAPLPAEPTALTETEAKLLRAIIRHGAGRADMLAIWAGIGRQAVMPTLNRLFAKGYVARVGATYRAVRTPAGAEIQPIPQAGAA